MSQLKESKHLYIPFEEIKKATKDFENCIGKGGYGEVYKGELVISGKRLPVAVKRLDEKCGQGLKEFLTEIQLLSGQKHPNLINLFGYCDEGNEKIIVYEYAERGSLDKYLGRCSNTLTWLERLRICVGAARGLEYLHNHVGKHQTIIHRDIKSANILIDENWVAKVSDLGLSKLTLAGLGRSDVVTCPCGTLCYCEPDYFFTSIVKKESDVYSFGLVLFEVLCGKLIADILNNNGNSLKSVYAKEYFFNKSLEEIVDPSLKQEMNLNSRNKFAAIANGCLHDDRPQRPTMCLVLKELEESLNLQIGSEKVRKFFQLFDLNKDGGLNKEELEALLVTKNSDLKHCSQEQISSRIDELFHLYDKFVDGEKGLTLDGLLQIYDDGDGDLDLKELEELLNLQIGSDKVRGFFQLFDLNKDGGLNKEELEALLVATNSDFKHCSQEQISSRIDELFHLYDNFIDGEKGLTLDGLLRMYDDGDGDLDLDYEELGPKVKHYSNEKPIFSFSTLGRLLQLAVNGLLYILNVRHDPAQFTK